MEMYFEIMIAISDRFAFCKHRIRLGQLHKCAACEMCGFICSSGIIVIRNIKIMKGEEFGFYHQSLFGRCQFNSWFFASDCILSLLIFAVQINLDIVVT